MFKLNSEGKLCTFKMVIIEDYKNFSESSME